MQHKLKGVLIDLDDTLYDYEPCNQHAIKIIVDYLGRHYNIPYQKCLALFLESRKKVKKALPNNASSHSRLLYLKKLVEKIEGKTNPSLVLRLEKIFWSSYFKKMRLRKNAKEFLKQCRKKKLKTVIVTNLTARIQLEKAVKLGLNGLVDFVITSEEAGAEKPDPKMLEFALKATGLEKNNAIFVGDKEDLRAASNAEIAFILVGNDYDLPKAAEKIRTR